jgi:hypothetical protein
MKALNPLARLFAALAACVVVAMIAVATASAKQTVSALPPNGVYTCGWIATHPAAAARARVTCDASVFFSAMRQSPPIAGSVVTALASPDTIDSTGCWDIPEDGSRISPGVYAWSSWEYANRWSWAAHYGPPVDYTWYIQKVWANHCPLRPLDGTSAIRILRTASRWRHTTSIAWDFRTTAIPLKVGITAMSSCR